VGWVCVLFPVTCDKEHNTKHSHLTSYTIVEIKLSLGVIKIAGRDTTHVPNYTAPYSSRLYLRSDRREKPKSQKVSPF